MGMWIFMYDAPSKSKHVNKAELDYIEQDKYEAGAAPVAVEEKDEKKMSFLQCFTYKQTWAFAAGKFMTDGVWWFFLFWTPSYPEHPVRHQDFRRTGDGTDFHALRRDYVVYLWW